MTATCAWCGRRFIVPTAKDPTFCTPPCADSWMDAHPAEKERRGWMTADDLIRKLQARAGISVLPEKPKQGGN